MTSAALGWRQPPHRFNDTVARKLVRGHSVVVVHRLDDTQAAPVLAALQETSQRWCAEAPRSSVGR